MLLPILQQEEVVGLIQRLWDRQPRANLVTQNHGAFNTQIRDPFFWHDRYCGYDLPKGSSDAKNIYGGSKSADWRGWVKYGRITVTA